MSSEVYKRKPFTEEARKKMCEAKRGEKHPNWKGGRLNKNGYIEIWKPNHPYANIRRYVLEHRLVMEKKLGRYLLPLEVVHHINNVRNDNCPENLELFNKNGEHLCKYPGRTHNKCKSLKRS